MNPPLNSNAVDPSRSFGSAGAPGVVAAARIGRATAKRSCTSALIALAAIFGVAAAHASCADPRTPRAAQARLALATPAVVSAPTLRGGPASEAIVGTWLVTYTMGGAPAGQAYIQWHSDGTEWENINAALEGGNICMGSWKKVDARHVSRNHYGWIYSGGILNGYFNETEMTEVERNGTYNGITDFKLYDLDGNLQVELSGTSSAVLIAP